MRKITIMVMIKGGKRNEKNNKVVMQCIACSKQLV